MSTIRQKIDLRHLAFVYIRIHKKSMRVFTYTNNISSTWNFLTIIYTTIMTFRHIYRTLMVGKILLRAYSVQDKTTNTTIIIIFS